MARNVNFSFNSSSVDFVYTVGKKNVYSEMQLHPYFELYFFIGGSVEYIDGHIQQKLSPNSLVVIQPGSYHRFHVPGNIDIYERCVLNIRHDLLEGTDLVSFLRQRRILELSENDRITQHFKYLISCIPNTDVKDFEAILTAVASDILYLIKYSREGEPSDKPSSISSLAGDIMSYIDRNYQKQLNLEELSVTFNYSVSHITHVFKEKFGISIKNYIIQRRLSSAQSQMLLGVKTQQAAAGCGFSDYASFYRAYKKAYGSLPSELKKK